MFAKNKRFWIMDEALNQSTFFSVFRRYAFVAWRDESTFFQSERFENFLFNRILDRHPVYFFKNRTDICIDDFLFEPVADF